MTVALVSSTGGHLAELVHLRRRFKGVDEVVWITFDSAQSRSLLEDEDPIFVPYTGPRQLIPAVMNAVRAFSILRAEGVTAVVSSGAAVALSFMVPARMLGLPCVYIESAARSMGPSLTARLLRFLPGVRFYTQYPALRSERWAFAGSVFDGYASFEVPAPTRNLKVVVTVGSLHFPFRRFIERLASILPESTEVVWQTGGTQIGDLPIRARPFMPEADLRHVVEAADVVISHAGIGSALMALESGRLPILVPRLQRYAEHVDDHQTQIADELVKRGLAISCSAHELSFDLIECASRRVVADAPAPSISLPLGRRHA